MTVTTRHSFIGLFFFCFVFSAFTTESILVGCLKSEYFERMITVALRTSTGEQRAFAVPRFNTKDGEKKIAANFNLLASFEITEPLAGLHNRDGTVAQVGQTFVSNWSDNSRFRICVFVVAVTMMRCDCENGDVCSSPVCESEAESVLAKLDETVDPCEDFYRFACGRFLNSTAIPDDKTSVEAFTLLDDKLKEQLKEVLNSSITGDDIGPFVNSKKLYKACLNEGERCITGGIEDNR